MHSTRALLILNFMSLVHLRLLKTSTLLTEIAIVKYKNIVQINGLSRVPVNMVN